MMANDKCPACGEPVGPHDQKCSSCGRGLSGKALLGRDESAEHAETSGAATALAVVAFIGAGVGLLSASQATIGVGMVAAACLLAIFARMLQATVHQRNILNELRRRR